MEISRDIHLIKYPCGTSWSGMVLIRRERTVLIDTAFEPAIDAVLLPYLKKLDLKVGDIDLIINTHVHGDHIGGNARLLKESGASLAVHGEGIEKLRDPCTHLNKIRSCFPEFVPFQRISSGLTSLEPDVILQDGASVDLGDSELRIIHTPGHDRECVCIFHPDTGCLFSGDSLQGKGTLSAGLAFYQDLSAYRNSLQSIENMQDEIRLLVAAHPFSPMDGVMAATQVSGFLAHCRDTMELYDRELRIMLKGTQGKVDLKYFTESLLAHAGLTNKPTVPILAYHTVASHLKEITGEEIT